MIKSIETIFQQITSQAEISNVSLLSGGVSADSYLVTLDNSNHNYFIKFYGTKNFTPTKMMVEKEFQVLKMLYGSKVPVPKPIFADSSQLISDYQYIIVEYIEQASTVSVDYSKKYIEQLAHRLADIHSYRYMSTQLNLLTDFEFSEDTFMKKVESIKNSDIQRNIRSVTSQLKILNKHGQPSLLHGDYWPGNVLCRDGDIVAIIDWEDAQLGNPLLDLSNVRWELWWDGGKKIAQEFMKQYQKFSKINLSNMYVWDLYAGVTAAADIHQWGLNNEDELKVRKGVKTFLVNALENLR